MDFSGIIALAIFLFLCYIAVSGRRENERQEEMKKQLEQKAILDYQEQVDIYNRQMAAYKINLDKMEKGEIPTNINYIQNPPVKPVYNPNTANMPRCPKCGNTQIQYSFNTTQHIGRSKTEMKKRSLANRTANKAGRGFMNAATLGMYGVFAPKKGKYIETTNATTTMVQQKIAICQTCGCDWIVR